MGYNQTNTCMAEKILSPNKDRFSDKLCTRGKKEAGLETHSATKLHTEEG